MKTHGILFSASMVSELLAGRKTVTRRLSERWMRVKAGDLLWVRETFVIHSVCRSEFGIGYRADHPTSDLADGDGGYNFRSFPGYLDELKGQYEWAENHCGADRWLPSIHMPRWASRITLEATEDARREPLQEITEEDAIAEGCRADEDPYWRPSYNDPDSGGNPSARLSYEFLLDSLNKDRPWASNPSVVRLAFRECRKSDGIEI